MEKIKILCFVFCVCLLIGCMSNLGRKYSTIFNEAVSEAKNINVISPKSFEEIKDKSLLELKVMGYKRVIYAQPEQGFIVVAKNPIGGALLMADATAFILMVKFTSLPDGQTRVDLVEGSDYVISKRSVRSDISKLADFIKSL